MATLMLLLVLLLMLLFMLILHAYVMLLLCLGVGRDAIPALELIESDRAVSTGNSHGAGAHRLHSTLSYSLPLCAAPYIAISTNSARPDWT